MATIDRSPAAALPDSPNRSAAPGRAWRSRGHLVMLVLALCVVLLSGALQLRGREQVVVPLVGALPCMCAWRGMLGIDCPGCGLTRSFVALAHGHVVEAWHFNPAGLLLFAVVLYQIPFHAVQLWRLRAGRDTFRHGPWMVAVTSWVLVAALVAQWVWRLC